MADKGSLKNACVTRFHGNNVTTSIVVRDPYGLAIDEVGCVYATDCCFHRLYKFDNNLNFIKKVGNGKGGRGDAEFSFPHGVDVIHGMVYVCDNGSCRVKVYDQHLNHKYSFGDRKAEQPFDEKTLFGPVDIAGDSEDGLYVADNKKMAIVKFRMRVVGAPEFVRNIVHKELRLPSGLTIDSHDLIYVTDKLNNHILVFNSKGTLVTTLWKTFMQAPRAICCEKGRDSAAMYVSDNHHEVNVWKCDIQYIYSSFTQ